MSSPRYPCVLTRCGVHRVKVSGNVVGGGIAIRPRRVEQDFPKLVCGTRHHRTPLACSEIDDADSEAMATILHGYAQNIAGVVEEGVAVRDKCRSGCKQWA